MEVSSKPPTTYIFIPGRRQEPMGSCRCPNFLSFLALAIVAWFFPYVIELPSSALSSPNANEQWDSVLLDVFNLALFSKSYLPWKLTITMRILILYDLQSWLPYCFQKDELSSQIGDAITNLMKFNTGMRFSQMVTDNHNQETIKGTERASPIHTLFHR